METLKTAALFDVCDLRTVDVRWQTTPTRWSTLQKHSRAWSNT